MWHFLNTSARSSAHFQVVGGGWSVLRRSVVSYNQRVLPVYDKVTQPSLTNRATCLSILTFEKYRDFETAVRGHWRSFEMSPFNRAHATSYWRSVVTMALSSVVSGIFNVKKCLDLEIRARGHSRSLKVVPFDRLRMVLLLVFYSNFVRKMYRF